MGNEKEILSKLYKGQTSDLTTASEKRKLEIMNNIKCELELVPLSYCEEGILTIASINLFQIHDALRPSKTAFYNQTQTRSTRQKQLEKA
jgi:hypothetical protein